MLSGVHLIAFVSVFSTGSFRQLIPMVSIVSIIHTTSGFIFLVLFPPPSNVKSHISKSDGRSELTIFPCSQNSLPVSSVSLTTSLFFYHSLNFTLWKIHYKILPKQFCLIILVYRFSYPHCHILGQPKVLLLDLLW